MLSWKDKDWLRLGVRATAFFMSLALGYFFVARPDEIFASPAGAVHPVHCLTRRDVALCRGERRLTSLQWHQATSIEVRFRGHKGDQAQQRSVIVRTRDDASGTRSGVGAAMAPSLSWWSYCRYIRLCRKVPPCRRIGAVTRLELSLIHI